ncbi:Pyrroline-5-carboxylate reductase [Corynebacterium pseudotuberculosis]|nr:Pyrroline-5-carboxylate reductase [Corynebacterium pseudotuberculosis]APQ55454.1 Pyrroline-5-carboxylate reductase [Corynebacterium pseudotuberculosis]AUY59672.1 Pyrroline-5-carboxylate reductase [Corynebacterium pseudotuberculosis]
MVAMTSIAVIGGGKIGEALISGLIAAGMNPKNINVTNRNAEHGQALKEKYGVVSFTENIPAVDQVDVVFLCVKPKQIIKVVEEIADAVDNNSNTTVVSMAAGVNTAAIEEILAAGSPVIRVMPNTPMLVGKGNSAVAPGRFADQSAVEQVRKLLETVGNVTLIEESDLDAVVALSGSSPAYLFLFAEALIDAGVNLGLNREQSKELAVNAFYGAAAMLKETGEEPAQLRANVCSPAGTTIAAIREMEESGLRGMVYRAAEAAAKRNGELG